DLLEKVQFISRFYADEGQIAPAEIDATDDVAQFISRIERTDTAFQRDLSKAKVAAIKNFYETAVSQPPIPGTVLLFTPEKLGFEPLGKFENVGNLESPRDKYLIIDGRHRLAALHFFRKERPDDARGLHVPCVIFDGKSEDFATEMFVIINSTPTRINKSHLVDLYERVSWSAPDKKLAAQVVGRLYVEGDSPLRYRINRLGGRSQQQKWILQAELFNEIHRWVSADWKALKKQGTPRALTTRLYEDRSGLPQGSREGLGRRLGRRRLHDHPSGDAEGDAAGLRGSGPHRRGARGGAGQALGTQALPLGGRGQDLPQRGVLRAVPGQGAGRTRRPHPPRARTPRGNRPRGAQGTRRRGVSCRVAGVRVPYRRVATW